jgi:fatty-acyl-CoA synthase
MTQNPSLSYVHGVSRAPLIGETIGAYFDRIAGRFGKREALVVRHQAVRWTYAQLKERVDNAAASFLRLGLKPGDRLGIWAQNCSEWVITQFASAKAGLILVTINPAYRGAELAYALNKAGCKALILSPRFKTSDYIAMLAEAANDLPMLKTVIRTGIEATPGMINFNDLLRPASDGERLALAETGSRLQFDDPINIQFTSGTTGAPKGATLTHHNILNNGFVIGETMALSEQDRMCIPVPLYHCFGMVIGNLAALTHGSVMVFPGESFEAEGALRCVEAERCTVLHGVPAMFIAMLEHPALANFDLTSLRTGMMAGAPCPIAVMRRVVERMHMREITIGYGMTETSPVSFQCSLDDPIERRVTTVGRVHPHVEVKIVDKEGRIVPRGTKGELLTRGYSVMLGYWDDEEKTREAIDAAGWMHTGDLAMIDAEGYCNIAGREKDMIIRGGENVFPREIEEFLHRHPKIQDVQVIGVPDPKLGEEACALIVLKPGVIATAEEIRAFCKGKIAHYKIPRYVKFVQSYPMTVSGKVQKFLLREQISRELGLSEAQAA